MFKPFSWLAVTLALALAGGLAREALAQDDNAPVVGAPKIIEALSKDVVLDRPGNNGAPAPRRDPSISLQVQFAFGSAQLLLTTIASAMMTTVP